MDDTLEQKTEECEAAEITSREQLLKQIGCKLLAARESRGIKIDQAVVKLKLQKVHLQALEAGNWEQLLDQVYALGFLRQYAQYLKLDLSTEIGQLNEDLYKLTKPLTFPDPPVSPSKKWAWVAGIGFVLLFIMFNIMDNSEHNETITTVSNERAADNYNKLPVTNTDVELDDGLKTEVAPEPKPTHKAVVDLTAKAPDITPEPATISLVHEYRFEAVTGAVWMQVYAPNASGAAKGKLLKEVLLQEGQYSTVRLSSESLWINCGNALSLRVKVDGKIVSDTGKLGGGKKILRDFRFSIK